MSSYKNVPMGSKISFFDGGLVVDGEESICEGFSVGAIAANYIPVFAERSGGREPTTIMVHVDNILDVDMEVEDEG